MESLFGNEIVFDSPGFCHMLIVVLVSLYDGSIRRVVTALHKTNIRNALKTAYNKTCNNLSVYYQELP